MIRRLLSLDPAELDTVVKVLFRQKILVDFSSVTKFRDASSILVNVKCDDPTLAGIIRNNFKKSVIVRR